MATTVRLMEFKNNWPEVKNKYLLSKKSCHELGYFWPTKIGPSQFDEDIFWSGVAFDPF